MLRCAPARLLSALLTVWMPQHAGASEGPSPLASLPLEAGRAPVDYSERDSGVEILEPLKSLRWGFRSRPSGLQASTVQTWPSGAMSSSPSGLRPPTRQGHGLRIVEVAPLLDPARPFQRPARALEFPAVITTARAQDWGVPLRDCVHRLRLPSRISDAGALSVQAQWHLRCNF